jgi:addiction module HigA family antidote
MVVKRLDPIHPGEILEEDFMHPLGLSANALAKAVDVPVTRISEIVRGRRGVTADTALRFARFFGTSAELWLGLQSEYDLRTARRDFGESIEASVSRLKTPRTGYENDSPRAEDRSEIRESAPAYGRAQKKQTRDRRRARRLG